MKLRALFAIMLLAGMAVVYTACKKSDAAASGPALTAPQVASQVALDITADLFGGYGGLDFSGGLQAPTGFGVKQHTQGRLLHDMSNPFCGLVIDTALNATETVGVDSTVSVSGHIYFAFSCTNDNVTGFTTKDDLNIGVTTPQFSIVAKINENLTVASIDPTNDNSKLSMNGSLASSGTYNYKTAKKSGTKSFNYVLTHLVLDPDNDGDITSGSASFITKGTGSNGSWSYTGTITFLGNHKATITINGKTYNVDLRTGATS
ncbi:hypothetical protein [Mucilaginibacter sp.]|uniref:hypothetical protein n=1 Tax=Mucilaginibacter sp. TaxID=1882438 RepID=UPI0025FB9F71|nr:hypothetical protein [Mucilaginibacter sp.]